MRHRRSGIRVGPGSLFDRNKDCLINPRHSCIAVGWTLVGCVVYLSLTPKPPETGTNDKLSHFLAYGTLMFWFALLYRGTRPRVLYAAGFVAMGVAIEFLQPFTGRQFEPADMLANTIGVLLGWGATLLVSRWLPRS